MGLEVIRDWNLGGNQKSEISQNQKSKTSEGTKKVLLIKQTIFRHFNDKGQHHISQKRKLYLSSLRSSIFTISIFFK